MASTLKGKPNFGLPGKFQDCKNGKPHSKEQEMVTLDAINLKIAKLQKQAATIAEKQTSEGLTKIRDLMHKHGLSIADIESFVGKKRGGKTGTSGAKAAAKTPHVNVHHAAPKYADPKTGATWTGRGRAPAWIRDVKDRSKFLIEAGAKKKDAGLKAAPAKKVSAKRVVAKKAVSTPAVTKKAAGRRAAAPGNGARVRKAAAPAKETSAPRNVAARKAPPALEAGTTPEVAAA
ncbi:H-NS histone family protein [Paraburkholderia acidipaludis]|uniref:H-NS histone family protein n=1 Tax=Paraburkholderia acidipaludis TaxID=660537 RepID=UPI000A46DE97|nr:H-NS histone family protein [Paraburkholderia acidipaludis]